MHTHTQTHTHTLQTHTHIHTHLIPYGLLYEAKQDLVGGLGLLGARSIVDPTKILHLCGEQAGSLCRPRHIVSFAVMATLPGSVYTKTLSIGVITYTIVLNVRYYTSFLTAYVLTKMHVELLKGICS